MRLHAKPAPVDMPEKLPQAAPLAAPPHTAPQDARAVEEAPTRRHGPTGAALLAPACAVDHLALAHAVSHKWAAPKTRAALAWVVAVRHPRTRAAVPAQGAARLACVRVVAVCTHMRHCIAHRVYTWSLRTRCCPYARLSPCLTNPLALTTCIDNLEWICVK